VRVFQLLATASGNRWSRAAFEQLSDQRARLWVTVLKDRGVPEQLQRLMDRSDHDVAGRRPEEMAEHLPRLITESGRAAQDLFRRLVVTDAGPPDLTAE
jgi:hypothetical protein